MTPPVIATRCYSLAAAYASMSGFVEMGGWIRVAQIVESQGVMHKLFSSRESMIF